MTEFLKCPNCSEPTDSTMSRCPVCEETLSAPIEFERPTGVHTASGRDSFRLRWQRNNTEQNASLTGPWNGDATVDDLIAALQQNHALWTEVLRGMYEVRGMATDHAREVGRCIGCHKDKRLSRIVPRAGKIGLCQGCADVIRLYGRDTE